MGQKVNPKGFRLISTENYLSNWFIKKNNYKTYLKEDFIIRSKIEENFINLLNIANINIDRINNTKNSYILINIFCIFDITIENNLLFLKNYLNLYPYFNISNKLNGSKLNKYIILFIQHILEKLIKNFQLNFKKEIFININFIKDLYENIKIIAKLIEYDLKERIPYRRILKEIIPQIFSTINLNGLKIQISGRLNGIEMARTEWLKEGQLPLNTIRAEIKYISYSANTIYGLIGIKIWLFLE